MAVLVSPPPTGTQSPSASGRDFYVRTLCATAGVLVAHRRFSGLTTWKRILVPALIGTGTGELGYRAFHWLGIVRHTTGAKDERSAVQIHRKSLLNTSKQAWNNAKLGECWLKESIGGATDRELRQSKKVSNSLAFTETEQACQLTQGGRNRVISRGGPHDTAAEPGEIVPLPVPYTNYDWKVTPQRMVPELEAHMSKLRAHREKLSTQAHTVWQWSGEKDAQYYHIRDCDTTVGYDAEQAKRKLRRYCETLASEHLRLWMVVSKLDWILADSKKRITQYRQISKGEYHAPNAPSSTSRVSNTLSFLLSRLRDQDHLLENAIEGHTRTVAAMQTDLGDPNLPNILEPNRSELRAKSKKDRERLMRDALEHGKKTRDDVILQRAVVEEILGDGEKRASRLVKDG